MQRNEWSGSHQILNCGPQLLVGYFTYLKYVAQKSETGQLLHAIVCSPNPFCLPCRPQRFDQAPSTMLCTWLPIDERLPTPLIIALARDKNRCHLWIHDDAFHGSVDPVAVRATASELSHLSWRADMSHDHAMSSHFLLRVHYHPLAHSLHLSNMFDISHCPGAAVRPGSIHTAAVRCNHAQYPCARASGACG